MKLKQNIDIVSFLNTIKKCTSDVYLQTAEGDSLNLKSNLSQYIFVSLSFSHAPLMNGTVLCADPEDEKMLKYYLE